MNRLPGIICIVLLMAVVIRYLPKVWPGLTKIIRRVGFPLYIIGILYLTILSRVISPRKLFNWIFNAGYIPTEEIIIGNRGSEWLAGKKGVRGIRLLLIGLSDPNSKLYIIPSCLMNFLLFLPLGMMFCLYLPKKPGRREMKRYALGCSAAVLVIECIQYFFGMGQFDLLDILFNTLGFVSGILVYWTDKLTK